ncbi:serine/threonine-protein kinase [Trichocoleus desertorum]|uniref:serine/threonine-protein kinase n=1 Tax=Trichocoleus desertorum TaxID=1481672 RepID=UPI0032997F7F
MQLANRYKAIQVLGQGGCSRTLLAVDQVLTPLTLCVIKQLWSDVTSSSPMLSIQERSRQAFQCLKKLESSIQLPTYLDQFEQNGILYLVQQFIPGDDLALVLAQKGTFNTREVCQILVSLLPVIQQIHTCGVIHGDIKPENIICRVSGVSCSEQGAWEDLVLVDVGITQLLAGMKTLQPRMAIGSPTYGAPEQLKGNPTFASDLYSLGVTCIHLLTGIHPFSLFDSVNHRWAWQNYWLSKAANAEERLQQQNLAQLLDRLIEPDLNQRIASAEEVLLEVQFLRGEHRSTPVSQPMRSPTWKCYATLTGHGGLFANINAIAISPNSQMLASASDDKTIRLWDIQAGKEQFTLHDHAHFVKTVAFHPQDDNLLVSGSRDRTIKLWNLQTRSVIQILGGHDHTVNAVLFSPDGAFLASGSSDKQVKLWDWATGKVITSLTGHDLAVTALAFSPNASNSGCQSLLASAGADASVQLWDLKTFERVHTLTGHTANVRAVAFSPAGRWLATAGDDRTIRLWDLASQQTIHVLSGHSWPVSALAFSSDGETLISGSWDKTVKLWQVSTGKEIETLVGHTDSVSDTAIAPDRGLVASASYDRTIKLWRMSLFQPTS